MSNRHADPAGRDREVTGPTRQTRPRSPSEALEPAQAPSRPRRSRREPSRRLMGLSRVGSGLLTLLLAMLLGAGAATLWLFHEFERPGPLTVSRTFGVPRGEGPIEISARLEREGIIANRWAFVTSHSLRSMLNRGKPQHLKAGEYEFKKGASMSDVLATLVEGKSILSKITLPEGLTSQQIVDRLMAEEDLAGEVSEVPPEGSLLPDTYRFSKGMSRQELIDRMRAEQQRYVASVWEKRQPNLPVSTPEEAVVLASIVEKETGRADEREKVAAVFVNRLRKGMRLQSDPTIIYGIVGGQGSLGRSITRSDIDGKTAYNTYQIKGLPPGPICNPGRSALAATLGPAATGDLYFVADGSGGHIFSETLRDHNAAVANWRKVEAQMAREAAARPERAPDAPPAPQQAQPASMEVPEQKTRAVSRTPPGSAAAEAQGGAGQPSLPVVTTLNPGGTAAKEPAVAAPAPAADSGNVPLPVRKPKR
ncbi:MAG: endolytic transglycosylase MltG [Hyphomicrobiaceae bacterium]